MKYLAFLAYIAIAGFSVAQDMRTVTDDLGNVIEIPVSPQRIVAVRSDCMATPLVELGAPMVGAGSMQSDNFNGGRPFIRGATQFYGTQFGDDLANIGFINEPDIEVIASLEPDLILIASWVADSYDNLSKIAPTYAADCFGKPLTEWLGEIADLAGMSDVYDAKMAAYELKLEHARAVLQDSIGDPSEVTVVFADPFPDGIYVAEDYGTFTVVADALGFNRKTMTEDMLGDEGMLSPELVEAIDSDFIFSSYQVFFDQPASQRLEQWQTLVPGFDELLHAPRNNQLVIIDRSLIRAFAIDGLETMISVLVSQVAERDFIPLED
ncbi:MAG: ABC transporter substrate-binding protein [Deinococcota bacterium]